MNHNMICEGRLKTGEAAFGAAEQVWWYKRTILRSAQVADIGDHAKRRVLVLISAGAQTQLVLQWRNSGECMQLHQTGQNYQILVIMSGWDSSSGAGHSRGSNSAGAAAAVEKPW